MELAVDLEELLYPSEMSRTEIRASCGGRESNRRSLVVLELEPSTTLEGLLRAGLFEYSVKRSCSAIAASDTSQKLS